MNISLDYTQDELRDFYFEDNVPVRDEPWYIEEPESEARTRNSSLCDVCKHVDFQYLLKNPVQMYHGPILLAKDMIAKRDECSFCDLALTTMSMADDEIEPVVEGEHVVCVLAHSTAVGMDASMIELHRQRLFHRGAGGSLVFIHQVHDEPKPFEGRVVSSSQADLRLLKSWLNNCEHDHGNLLTRQYEQDATRNDLPHLRAIDVHQHCIVDIGRGSRYVALSYVWGGVQQLRLTMSNHTQLAAPGSLLSEEALPYLPQTIQDAIYLVSSLGEQYLWVDSLCIVQDSPEKDKDIQNMDAIYENALVTVVAAFGNDANAGLVRIRSDKQTAYQTQQHVRVVQQMNLANVIFVQEEVIAQSVWSSRAWTYQERVLSKRVLFVSHRQVYFECIHGGRWAEDVVMESHVNPRQSNFQILGLEQVNFDIYCILVHEYSKRRLSFEADAIRAVSGALSHLKAHFRSEFLCGLPASELDMALLWLPSSSSSRRKSPEQEALFPSWSWAAWSGDASYLLTEAGEILSMVLWKDSSSGDIFSSAEYRQPDPSLTATAANWTRKFDEYHEIECFVEEDSPHGFQFVHPTAPQHERRARHFLEEGKDCLQFQTLCARFQITGDHAASGAAFKPCVSASSQSMEPHKVCSLSISKNGIVVGTVHIPGSIAATMDGPDHEFVLLSRTRLVSDDSSADDLPSMQEQFAMRSDDADDITAAKYSEDTDKMLTGSFAEFDTTRFDVDKPWCLYHVMCVETHEGIRYRQGLGLIHVDAFLHAGPTMDDVLLG